MAAKVNADARKAEPVVSREFADAAVYTSPGPSARIAFCVFGTIKHLRHPPLLHAEHARGVFAEVDRIAGPGEARQLLRDVPADRVDFAVVVDVGKLELVAQLAKRIGAGHAEVFAVLDEIRVLGRVEFIVDFADQFFDHIFERDDPQRRAVFINDDRHVNVAGLKLPQQARHGQQRRHEEDVAANFVQVDLAGADDVNHRARLAVGDGDRPGRRAFFRR